MRNTNKPILFNCTTNVVGGGVKNSAIFIRQALEFGDFPWHFAISQQVSSLLQRWGINLDLDSFSVFKTSPARSFASRKAILSLVKSLEPAIVYTMAGPAYVNFPVPHLQGLSNAYITHPSWEVVRLQDNLLNTLRHLIHVKIQYLYSKRCDFLIFQTEFARDSYVKRSQFNKSKTAVIPNAVDENLGAKMTVIKKKAPPVKIFTPGASYTHKAFQYLPAIAKELKQHTSEDFEFLLTLPDGKLLEKINKDADKLGVMDNITNAGPYNYAEADELFANADIFFIPSLLETFCASYLEAMLFQKPLVVANRGFAREICRDYAHYIEPADSKQVADVLAQIIKGGGPDQPQIARGKEIVNSNLNHRYRYQLIAQQIQEMIKHSANL